MANRDLLHHAMLEEFRDYCKRHHWMVVPTKGEYEVLRMIRPNHLDPIIVYRKRDSQYYTVMGASLNWAKRFIAETRR